MSYSLDFISEDCYEGTSVLINKLSITDAKQLQETESVITSVKAALLLRQPLKSNFGFDDYRDIHKFLFDELYDWAGKLRTIDISKSATHFVACNDIDDLGNRIFFRLKSMDYFKLLDRNDFVYEIADLYNSLNMLHPFREGNGRTQRVFFMQLIRNAGYEVNYSKMNSELLMIGTIQAASGVMDNLIRFFDENITT